MIATRLLAIGALLIGVAGVALPAAAECAWGAASAGPARSMALAEFLRLPKEPRVDLEGTMVTTAGYLIRARSVVLRPSAFPCAGQGLVYRLWLAPRKSKGMKALRARHRAVVATVTEKMVKERLGGPLGLRRLMGRRIQVTGGLIFDGRDRGELLWSRGTPWEIRPVSDIGVPRGDAIGQGGGSAPPAGIRAKSVPGAGALSAGPSK